MTQNIILLLAFLCANLPWFSEKLFYVYPLKNQNANQNKQLNKHLGWRLLELITFYFIVGGIALYAENNTMGQLAPQQWEFYAVTACLFLVFTFPGFVYRILWKK